jgi:hypothetical protein
MRRFFVLVLATGICVLGCNKLPEPEPKPHPDRRMMKPAEGKGAPAPKTTKSP